MVGLPVEARGRIPAGWRRRGGASDPQRCTSGLTVSGVVARWGARGGIALVLWVCAGVGPSAASVQPQQVRRVVAGVTPQQGARQGGPRLLPGAVLANNPSVRLTRRADRHGAGPQRP